MPEENPHDFKNLNSEAFSPQPLNSSGRENSKTTHFQTREANVALQKWFGFERFRFGQEDVIESVLSGRDVLLVMPTGGGKSLCYQIPGLCRSGITLVISPLIALMKDQVEALQARGIRADMLHSLQNRDEQSQIFRSLLRGETKFLYLAPERLNQERFLQTLGQCEISLVAIDEAHCVSQWGHDFRPDYLAIGKALTQLHNPQIIALTATATKHVQLDITTHLNLQHPLTFVRGFARPNLTFLVRKCLSNEEKELALLDFIEHHKTGIVYCASRKQVEILADFLKNQGQKVVAYHAGMDEQNRTLSQNLFIQKKCDIVIATNAFGMGIDRDDVRFVLHYDMPGSIESYYQEAGRAGRDGEMAHCLLLFTRKDLRRQEFFLDGNNPGEQRIRDGFEFLKTQINNQNELPPDFSPELLKNSLNWSNALHGNAVVVELTRMGILTKIPITGQKGFQFKLTQKPLELDPSELSAKEIRDKNRLNAMTNFVYGIGCRQMQIQEYFGEQNLVACGLCDNCQKLGHAKPAKLEEENLLIVLKILSCVARMSQKRIYKTDPWHGIFGRELIQLTLLGSKDHRVKEHHLNKLSTYGLLANLASHDLSAIFQSMLNARLLISSGGDHPKISLSELGESIMKRQSDCIMHWPIKTSQPQKNSISSQENEKKNTISPQSNSIKTGAFFDDQLFEKFKDLRRELASKYDLAQFQIFPNAVLESLVRVKPQTQDEAKLIHGITPENAQKYLPPFLEEIQIRLEKQRKLFGKTNEL